MPPAVDKVIFALAKGEVSEPVETQGGFQIFKVEDVKQEKTPTLKEATAEITKTLKTEKGKAGSGQDRRARSRQSGERRRLRQIGARERRVERTRPTGLPKGKPFRRLARIKIFIKALSRWAPKN